MKERLLLNRYKLNDLYTLKNRIVMAPMTRCKASNDFVPSVEMAEYYARRADAGLIITEGTIISENARGHDNVPGIFNQKQIDAWTRATDHVHENNGLIFLQIWHVGRVSHPFFLEGKLPISSSQTKMTGRINRSNGLSFGEARSATQAEIKELINCYAVAAENAIKAGFDGVEIHGANGYLVDQFLHYHTNNRNDEYGGSPENMARFALDVVKACRDAIGSERVGLRLSPGAYLNEMVGDIRDALVFKYLLRQLNSLSLAYVHTGNFDDTQSFKELDDETMSTFLRSNYNGTVIGCGGYTIEQAEKNILQNNFDLIAIGRRFIANPDLISRLYNKKALDNYDASMLATLY